MSCLKRIILNLCSISGGEAFASENYGWQSRMMDAVLTGLDRALVGFA